MVSCTSLSNATSRKDESDSDSSLFLSTTEVSDSDESENELQLDPIVSGEFDRNLQNKSRSAEGV